MGCKCSYINDNVDDYTFELYRTTIIKHKISENTKHIRNLIRIQSRIRGMQTREKLKNLFNQSKYNTSNRLTTISTSRISDLEINSLFNQYPLFLMEFQSLDVLLNLKTNQFTMVKWQ